MPTIELYKSILDRLYEGVYLVDQKRRILSWNRGAERITGFSEHEMAGRFCYENLLQHVSDDGRFLCQDGCPLTGTLLDGEEREALVYLHHRNGHRVPVMVRVMPLFQDGLIIGAAESFTDDVERFRIREEMAELTTQARQDPLTGLGNRRYGEVFLSARQEELDRLGIPYGVILFDLDHFKRINDQYGHAQGDQVLKTVARTLQDVSRQHDAVIRWGGEEFLVIVSSVSEQDLLDIADRMRHLVNQSTLSLPDGILQVTVSGGVCLGSANLSPDQCVEQADRALYRAKKTGRNRICLPGE